MKNLFFNKIYLIRFLAAILFIGIALTSAAQHIQYRDKRKPVPSKDNSTGEPKSVPKPDNKVKILPRDTTVKQVAVKPDTSTTTIKSKAAFTLNPRPKKPYVEDHNICDLTSKPDAIPQLPLIINNVSDEMIKMLKERYKGRLYSITGLNMIDPRLKYKLKLCDKNNAKFRSEYLDKDGNVVNDPDFDYD